MDEFYSDSLNRQRGNYLRRRIRDDLLETAQTGFFFQGLLYGNRGAGKSTEVNHLLSDPAIKNNFIVIRLDALNELNPQTFSVADVLLLLLANLIECCSRRCRELNEPFHEADIMVNDLQQLLAPFFPELQSKEQVSQTTGGSGEINFLQMIKLGVRVEGQRKRDTINRRENLAELSAAIERQISIAAEKLPGYELLIVGENFDKEQIPLNLLHDTFVQYASVLRDLRLHLLFTLPVPFVYAYGEQLAFRRENRYPVYDVPVFTKQHLRDAGGCGALLELIEKRCDLTAIFSNEAVELLLRASGGDLYRLFALIINSGRLARYRHEDSPGSERKVLLGDVEIAAREQLAIFRNEMGTSASDPDDTSWEDKLKKLRAIYEGDPAANVPDKALYQLLHRRAVLFFNGAGRYGVHPLAVEILREQLAADGTFAYRGGGLDLTSRNTDSSFGRDQ